MVTVREATPATGDRRDAVVIVEDGRGRRVPLTVWSTHDVDRTWTVGHRYELREVRGTSWERAGTRHRALHTTADFVAEDCGPASGAVTRLLVVGDTHVGYERRPDSTKPTWARDVDTTGALRTVFARADDLDADAVVHAGDLFDHAATDREFDAVRETLMYDRREATPFYYVLGDHDTPPARARMRELDGRDAHVQHLTGDLESVGDPPVNLFGVDHRGAAFEGLSLAPCVRSYYDPNVLVVHEPPPSAGDAGNGGDLVGALTDTPVEPDLVVCGHAHLPDRTVLDDLGAPVVATGPTVPISRVREEPPVAWLVTVDDGLTVTRHPL